MKLNNFSTFLVQNIGFFLVLFCSNVFLQTYKLLKRYLNEDFLDLNLYLKSVLVIVLGCFAVVFIAYIFEKIVNIIWVFFILNFVFFMLNHFAITHFDDDFVLSAFLDNLQGLKGLFNFGYLLKIFGFFMFHYILFRIKTKKIVSDKIDKIFLVFVVLLAVVFMVF